MNLAPGTLCVLEGIDKSGKSTQFEELRKQFPDDLFLHQPSSGGPVGEVVYQLTEKVNHMPPLARQLLHLAAHTEQYERIIIPGLSTRGVFLDRCWWSTVAYGWFLGGLQFLVDLAEFEKLARLPAQGALPKIVFVFLHEYERDPHNMQSLREGYNHLARTQNERCIVEMIPADTIEGVHSFIVSALAEHGLLVELGE